MQSTSPWLALFCFPLMVFAKDPPTWVELGSGGQVLARQVQAPGVTGNAGTCPTVSLTGGNQSSVPMTARGPALSGWPVVCEAVIPAGATAAAIGTIALALPKAQISNVVVVGDTGCAGPITAGETPSPVAQDDEEPAAKSQKCSGGWPLHKLSKTVSEQRPDLIIHVGDYVYVKDENWLAWDEQFFTPADKMLRAAPWIFVRGNHETCGRHGTGYFYLLDPRSATACTSDATDPILVSTGGQQYVMLDSSGATCDLPIGSSSSACSGNTLVPPNQQIPTWTALLKQAQALVPAGSSAVLLTHRPVWGAKSEKGSTTPTGFCATGSSKRAIASLNATLQGAWADANPTVFRMVYSGHTHIFALMTFQQGALPQLVVGDSGTELAHALPKHLSNCKLGTTDDPQPAQILPLSTLDSLQKWGFGAISGNKLKVYSTEGKVMLKCTVGSTSAACNSK